MGPERSADGLIFNAGDCDQNTQLATDYQSAKIGTGEGTVGQVWSSGIPAVRESAIGEPFRGGKVCRRRSD